MDECNLSDHDNFCYEHLSYDCQLKRQAQPARHFKPGDLVKLRFRNYLARIGTLAVVGPKGEYKEAGITDSLLDIFWSHDGRNGQLNGGYYAGHFDLLTQPTHYDPPRFKPGDRIRIIDNNHMFIQLHSLATVIEKPLTGDPEFHNDAWIAVKWDDPTKSKSDRIGKQSDGIYSAGIFELANLAPTLPEPGMVRRDDNLSSTGAGIEPQVTQGSVPKLYAPSVKPKIYKHAPMPAQALARWPAHPAKAPFLLNELKNEGK